ncbi:MAG TPA: GMC family oxidoreductase N-terminal domain-containing protein, partial [Vicinamibacterales bacterium]|nr:GMC family oxidoreductase N-terminal domain-containing protein [Vicinamibacterales bacterium]
MAVADGLTRRDFLAAAGAAPFALGRGRRQPNGPLPAAADVVVVGGDPAAYAAVFRLAQNPGLRVVLVDEALEWTRMDGPAEHAAVADLPPFARGHQACFDGWRDRGNPDWAFADVLPAFKRIETYEGGASATRGGDGPLSVAHCWDPHAAHRAFLVAAGPAGFRQDSRHDFNGPRSQSVAGYYQKAIRDDRPHTFAAAFLDPVRTKPAVSVAAGGHVSRLVMEGGRAVGVEYVVDGTRRVIRAERAVVLAAGPARAAQLLMLSGIGPAERLQALGVPVVADRPGVGANLHDQMILALRYAALQELPASTVSAGMF